MRFSFWPKPKSQKAIVSLGQRGNSVPLRCTVPALEELEHRLVPTGTWTPLTHAAPITGLDGTDPDEVSTMLLLPNGTVMAQDGGNGPTWSSTWFQLTPDSSGSYDNGTWSTLAAMSVPRLYYTSLVLPDGDVFVFGGEFTTPGTDPPPQTDVNSGEIYHPNTNTWTSIASIPTSLDPANTFGDGPSELLGNGTILTGYILGPATFIYNPATNTWSAGGTKLLNDPSDEETWVKLPNGDILSYNLQVFQTSASGAQIYNPATNTWTATSPVPSGSLTNHIEHVIGPGLLLPNGKVFFVGANNGYTALYDPATTSWTQGPDIPNGMVADNAPGAVLPDGNVLFVADSSTSSSLFSPPSTIFEYNPTASTITPVPVPAALAYQLQGDGSGSFDGFAAVGTRMLVLPNGQLLFSDPLGVWTYSEIGNVNPAWAPTITNIVSNGGDSYTLTGTQLNGLDEGANYGADAEMAENYPIVQITDSSGHVLYAQTSNWSLVGAVVTGATPETTQFTLPSGMAPGAFSVKVIANGIASASYDLRATPQVTVNTLNLTYGTALANAQLTSSATDSGQTVDGTFAFSTAGTLLHAGTNQSATVTFTPSDTVDYSAVTTTVTVNVAKALPTLAVIDKGGIDKHIPYPATATVAGVVAGTDTTPAPSLEGITPTLAYYKGSFTTILSLAGVTPLSGIPNSAGNYTVLASFPGSADYLSNAALADFMISPGKGNLGGVVFNDLNLNGFFDTGEPALSSQVVFLDLHNDGNFDPGDPSTTTDASGAFSFTDLAPGTYTVRQQLMGGVLLSVPASGSLAVTVTAGLTNSGQNFADVVTSIIVPLTLPLNSPFPAQGNGTADFVEGVYRAILQRNADGAGLSSWANQLNSSALSRFQVVQLIWNSPEHFSDEVDHFYLTLLGRAPDASGLANWTSELENGVSEEQVAFDFLNSPEYLSQGDKHFVDTMYETLLGRPYDPAGEASWLNLLGDDASGNPTHSASLTHAAVINDFLFSQESLTRLVNGYYQIFLLRLPDASGLSNWVSLLSQGLPFTSIGQQFIASDEFFNRAAANG